jgi:hypothetical protein
MPSTGRNIQGHMFFATGLAVHLGLPVICSSIRTGGRNPYYIPTIGQSVTKTEKKIRKFQNSKIKSAS